MLEPDAVNGLVLVSTAASRRVVTGGLSDPSHPKAGEAAEAMRLAATDPAASTRKLFQLSVADPVRNSDLPSGDDVENSAERLAAFVRELPKFDLEPELESIKQPTLVLVGRHDSQCPVGNSERIADEIPGAELHVFDDSGH